MHGVGSNIALIDRDLIFLSSYTLLAFLQRQCVAHPEKEGTEVFKHLTGEECAEVE